MTLLYLFKEEEPEHPSASQIKEEIDVKSDPENLDNESVEHSDDDTSSDRDSGKGNIMLDVLAQVAAATLEKDEPAAFTKKKVRKLVMMLAFYFVILIECDLQF